jgi:hypothetical protein
VDRLPTERAARDGGPGFSSAAGCEARKERLKILSILVFSLVGQLHRQALAADVPIIT